MNEFLERAMEATLGYLVFGGVASAAVLFVLLLILSPATIAIGARRALRHASSIIVFSTLLFLFGLPANVLYTLVMRERFYTDNDPIVDWLPWVPSGDWIIDVACRGHYLNGATVWFLRGGWALLAVPVWTLTVLAYRRLYSYSRTGAT